MMDTVKRHMVTPFQFQKLKKLVSTKFGLRLILLWPFSDPNQQGVTNAHVRQAGVVHGVFPSRDGTLAAIFGEVAFGARAAASDMLPTDNANIMLVNRANLAFAAAL